MLEFAGPVQTNQEREANFVLKTIFYLKLTLTGYETRSVVEKKGRNEVPVAASKVYLKRTLIDLDIVA